MKNCDRAAVRTTRALLPAFVAAGTLSLAVALPQAAPADELVPPLVPSNLQVQAGNEPFLLTHAVGTQAYICLPSGSKVDWTFVGPQATLFDDQAEQVLTHFLSPNPLETGTPRATWQHSRDTSAVWALRLQASTDPDFVAEGAIPWLLLQVVGAQDGPTGGTRLSGTTFIQRVNTTGGSAPSTGCKVSKDLHKTVFVPYTSDYVFYRPAD